MFFIIDLCSCAFLWKNCGDSRLGTTIKVTINAGCQNLSFAHLTLWFKQESNQLRKILHHLYKYAPKTYNLIRNQLYLYEQGKITFPVKTVYNPFSQVWILVKSVLQTLYDIRFCQFTLVISSQDLSYFGTYTWCNSIPGGGVSKGTLDFSSG